MSKKFIVEIDACLSTCEDIKRAISTADYYMDTYLKVSEYTELPQPPEVKKIEMGVLMSPAEITQYDKTKSIDFDNEGRPATLDCTHPSIGKRVNLSGWAFPRNWYKNIETTWDFNSIPVGSLVDISYDKGIRVMGWVVEARNGYIHLKNWSLGDGLSISGERIKSIRIVEGAK